MSDIDDELLDLAGEGTDTDTRARKRKGSSSGNNTKSAKYKSQDIIDDDETEDDLPNGGAAADEEEEDDMDIDLESEDGYGDRGAVQEPSAPTTAQTSARASPDRSSEDPEERPAPVKRDSSSKRPKPKDKKVPAPKGRAVKRKAPASKPVRESATEPEARNPYPLEGKFKDENDRDYLLGLPEIEREEIIASRLEEHQKFVDRQQLAALYSRTNPGEAPARAEEEDDEDAEGEEDMEMDMEIDQDSEEELGRGATRVKTTSEPKSKALDKLAERRKARTDRANNRTTVPKARKRDDDSDAESLKSEGSEYGARPGKKSRRGRSVDMYSDEESDFDRNDRDRRDKPKKDDQPVDLETIHRVQLTREDLAEYKHRTFFDIMIKGAYVRCIAGQDERKQPKYRLFLIVGLTGEERKYEMDARGKSIPENRRLNLKYGKVTRPYKMAEVSNSKVTESEFRRWQLTMDTDDVALPFRSDVEEKAVKLSEFKHRNVTDEEIQARLSAMQRMGAGPANDREEEILKSELSLAQRRHDTEAAKALQAQLVDLQSVRIAQEQGKISSDTTTDMLAKVNERSKRIVQDAHKRAFKIETERKRLALGDFKLRRGLDTPSPRGSPAPNQAGASSTPVDVTKNEQAKVTETTTGDVAVELDLGDF